jgi:hypothetical protein
MRRGGRVSALCGLVIGRPGASAAAVGQAAHEISQRPTCDRNDQNRPRTVARIARCSARARAVPTPTSRLGRQLSLHPSVQLTRCSRAKRTLGSWSRLGRLPRPTGYVEPMRLHAQRPAEIEFSAELEDDAAQSGFSSPRPRAGRVGEVANLYGHVLDNIQTDPMPPTARKTGAKP